ncbi:MAG: diaminopimelate decarboxylase [Salibacteraceae bacterium]
MSRISKIQARQAFERARDHGLLSDADTVVQFFDFDILETRLSEVSAAFPPSTTHCVAVKANPLTAVIKHIASRGFGLEAASFEEWVHAHRASPKTAAWDSPAKTEKELKAAETMPPGIISLNNLQEAELIAGFDLSQHLLMLRINPEISYSAHGSMTVAGTFSKFGEPISNRKQIIQFLLGNSNICGLHVHTSSQTTDFGSLIKGIEAVVGLAEEVNSLDGFRVSHIDIGGGFAVNYGEGNPFDIAEYARQLYESVSRLARYQVITEFGRFYHAHAGFTAAQVASRVDWGVDKQCLIIHAGAEMMLRECYQPSQWPHLVTSTRPHGETLSTDLGGPLCFGGDYPLRNVHLPKCNRGDWVFILDTGANSLALWSHHCSRPFPKVIGYNTEGMSVIRQRAEIDETLSIWG